MAQESSGRDVRGMRCPKLKSHYLQFNIKKNRFIIENEGETVGQSNLNGFGMNSYVLSSVRPYIVHLNRTIFIQTSIHYCCSILPPILDILELLLP